MEPIRKILTRIGRAVWLIDVYVVKRLFGGRSTASFWYLPDPPNIKNASDLETYRRSETSPFYLIDYSTRTTFDAKPNAEGILTLPYGRDIGDQINPEAAFQYALGLHDRYLASNNDGLLKHFLHYATYFSEVQTGNGDFQYQFDWFESRAPWHSALAQSRGVSVMLRAYLLTGDIKFKVSAERAIARFSVACEDDGYSALFPPTGMLYFEEYPAQRNAVINGFMASLFGLYELGLFLNNERATILYKQGLRSLETMLPHYTLSWWTIYDRYGFDSGENIHSPRYHVMVVNYLTVLAEISGSEIIRKYRDLWSRFDTPFNRVRAYALKFKRKIVHR